MGLQASPPSLLIVGSSSTIGRSLAEWFTSQNHPVWLTTRDAGAVGPQTRWLDLAQSASTWSLANLPCQVAVLCAAVTSQKACQEDYATTYAINVTATVELAKHLVDMGTFVVFVSTNLVFDGTVPLVSADRLVNPQTTYGQQKAEAEQALMALGSDSVAIVRLSKVLDENYALFRGWIDNLKAGQPIYPFEDLYFAPISLQFVTNLLIQVSQQCLGGITQASATHDLSYAEVAYHLAQKFRLDTNLIHPVSCQSIGIAHVPRFTTLNTDRLQILGIYPPAPWRSIAQYYP